MDELRRELVRQRLARLEAAVECQRVQNTLTLHTQATIAPVSRYLRLVSDERSLHRE